MNYGAEGTRDVRAGMSSFSLVFWVIVVNCNLVHGLYVSIRNRLLASPETPNYGTLARFDSKLRNQRTTMRYQNLVINNDNLSTTVPPLQNLQLRNLACRISETLNNSQAPEGI